MSRTTFGIRLVCAIAACVAVCAPAAAQSERARPTGGPFSGLFKGSPKDQPHTLDIRGSAFTAWDDNLLAQGPGGGGGDPTSIDPRFVKQGVANGFQGSAAYAFRRAGTRSQFNFTGDAGLQEYASGIGEDPFFFHTYNLSTGFRTTITNKTSISFGAGATYAPYFRYAPFLKNTASEESPVGSDYGFAVQSATVRSESASVSMENRFSKRSAVSAGIGWERSVIPGYEQSVLADTGDRVSPEDPGFAGVVDGNVQRRTAQASFSHNLTRKLGFRVGYGIQETRYASSPDVKPVLTHNMDVGLGYGDGVTFTFGRQTLSMSFGVSVARNGDPVSVATSGKRTAFVLDGAATLSRPIGRNWGTSMGYIRGTNYVVGFREPMMVESANAGIGGPLFSRLQFSAGAGASRGQQLFTQSGSGHVISYTASTRLTYGLFRNLGLYGQASYSRYSIPAGFANFGFVPDLDRRSVSVGLSTWLPLIKQRRARRDAGPSTTGQQ